MHEFEAVSVSSYEAGSLAAKLTEKSNEGWDVVAIVPAGSDITAYLKRSAGGSESATASASDATTPRPRSRPSSTRPPHRPSRPGGVRRRRRPRTDSGAGVDRWLGLEHRQRLVDHVRLGFHQHAGRQRRLGLDRQHPGLAGDPAQPAQPATPTVAADWYADPAGRYELRYWNGTAWTEHVSRNGQQFTDPPVA